jgi:hypothetical protein
MSELVIPETADEVVELRRRLDEVAGDLAARTAERDEALAREVADIVAQQHGETIEVASQPGEFSEFTVRLPRTEPG